MDTASIADRRCSAGIKLSHRAEQAARDVAPAHKVWTCKVFPQNFCYTTLPLHPLQDFYGWVIPSLSELCTQLHNAQVRVLPVHVGSEFAFLLVGHAGWMPMRPVGLADQGWAGPVVAAKPEVDVGPGVVALAA